MANRPDRYATDEATERKLLAALWFVGTRQAAFVLDERNSLALVRSELHRVYPTQMAAVDARLMAPPAPDVSAIMAEAQRVIANGQPFAQPQPSPQQSARAAALDAAFGITASGAPAAVGVRDEGSVQAFGVAVEAQPRERMSRAAILRAAAQHG